MSRAMQNAKRGTPKKGYCIVCGNRGFTRSGGPCFCAAAQGIEARSGETPQSGSTEGESPVGKADAPQTQPKAPR